MRPRIRAALFAILAMCTLQAADITLISGKTSKGKLVAVDAQFVSIQDGADVAKIPVKDMAVVDMGNKPAALPAGIKYDEIELTDGSILRHTEFKLKKKTVSITPLVLGSALAPELDLPMSTVFYLCRDAHDLASRERWKKLIAGRGKRDLFVALREGELDPEIGTILEGTEAGDRVVFQDRNDQKINILMTRASGGLVFNQPLPAVVPPLVCKVYDVFGNVLFAQSVKVEGSALVVKMVSGATATYKTFDSVVKLDFSQGNVAYLSDLDATVVAPPAAPDEPAPAFLKDKVFGNTPIRLAGRVYPKGLWIHPETTLTYKINGEYREFKAIIGIDDEGREASSASVATLVILADGRELLNQKYTRKDLPKEMTLNVKDVKELRFVVGRTDFFTGSHLDLGDARLQK